VLSINFSPRGELGNTEVVLRPLLEGMRAAGADVTALHANRLTIKPCLGEFACWMKTPGECIQKDDMRRLCSLLAQTDVWVFATPVYVDGVGGLMKNAMDRVLPLLTGLTEESDGHCRHPLRAGVKTGSLLLVSTCGYWELDNFGPLLVHMRAFCRNLSRQFAGALLRPHAGSLTRMMKEATGVCNVLDACRLAGEQLVRTGHVSPATLATAARELLSYRAYLDAKRTTYRERMSEIDLERPIPAVAAEAG